MRIDMAILRVLGRAAMMTALLAPPLAPASAQVGVPPPPSGAQPPSGGPPGPGGPPAPGKGGGSPILAPPEPPLGPGEKLAGSLPPPMPGGMIPLPPVARGAPPASADPRDLTGTWIHSQPLEFRMQRDIYNFRAPYTVTGAKVLERRVNSLKNGTPFINASAICRPPGPQWQLDLNFPFQVFQTKDFVRFVFQEYHGRWTIAYDPAKLPPGKEYQGRSTARWDGDTLVVTTDGFRQDVWLDVDGTPLSAAGKLTQRIRKVNFDAQGPGLEIVTTIDDPKYYTRPWSVARVYGWMPQAAYFEEYNCEEQIGDPSTSSDAGLVPEPKD